MIGKGGQGIRREQNLCQSELDVSTTNRLITVTNHLQSQNVYCLPNGKGDKGQGGQQHATGPHIPLKREKEKREKIREKEN